MPSRRISLAGGFGSRDVDGDDFAQEVTSLEVVAEVGAMVVAGKPGLPTLGCVEAREADEFTVYPAISPPWILLCESADQLADLAVHRRATGPVWVSPPAS
ncbi:MAG: hypothetical protein M3460_30680, partial [Actinomycetota bacterium]|nr:hypothetical protein [Actinomycetota bacterium]